MFPDQKDWLSKMHTAIRAAQYTPGSPLHSLPLTADGIMAGFGFTGPPEELSMETCFAADGGLASVSPEFLQWNEEELLEVGRRYDQEHGQWPHIAVAVDLLLQEQS